jgi:hypothetical protein
LTELITDENGVLEVAYGMHAVAGNLVVNRYDPGPPVNSKIIVALGEGEWDGVVALYYSNELLSGTAYHFHPGSISSGPSDPVQGVDSFLPTGITYNSTAYVAVNLPEKYATENRPDKLIGIYQCLKVPDYDRVGAQIGGLTYSANPARCAAHAIIYRAGLSPWRIDWSSWVVFRDWCDVELTWDADGDGVEETTVKRAECHVAFLEETSLATALDAICATAGTTWQDDGEKIRFSVPTNQTATFHFSDGSDGQPANILDGTFRYSARALEERPNILQCNFRNTLDEFLFPSSEITERELLQDRVGLVDPGARQFANMTYSQAQRLLERQLRIETDNPILAEFSADGSSFPVLPGDYVTIAESLTIQAPSSRPRPRPQRTEFKYIVIEATDESFEDTADSRSFIVQRIDSFLYADSDHRPVQAEDTP